MMPQKYILIKICIIFGKYVKSLYLDMMKHEDKGLKRSPESSNLPYRFVYSTLQQPKSFFYTFPRVKGVKNHERFLNV